MQIYAHSRLEDLSNLVFVSNVWQAVVCPPISQSKAPKWHDSIHLSRGEQAYTYTHSHQAQYN